MEKEPITKEAFVARIVTDDKFRDFLKKQKAEDPYGNSIMKTLKEKYNPAYIAGVDESFLKNILKIDFDKLEDSKIIKVLPQNSDSW